MGTHPIFESDFDCLTADSAPHQHRTTPDLLQGHSTLTPTTKHLDPLTSSSLLGLGRQGHLGDHGGLESLLCNLASNQQLGLASAFNLLGQNATSPFALQFNPTAVGGSHRGSQDVITIE